MTDAKWTLTQIYNIVLPEGVVPADDQEALDDVLAVVEENTRIIEAPEYIADNLDEVMEHILNTCNPDDVFGVDELKDWARTYGLIREPDDTIKCWNCGEHNGVDE